MFLEGPLAKDIEPVFLEAEEAYSRDLSVTIHTQYGRLELASVTSLDVIEDYVDNYRSYSVLKFQIGAGDYMNHIMASKDYLEAEIVWSITDEVRFIRKYRARIPRDNEMPVPRFNTGNSPTETMNMKQVEVSLELVGLNTIPFELMRIQGGVYHETSLDVLHTVLSDAMETVKIRGDSPYDFIDMVLPNVKQKPKQILLNTHTPLTGLPEFMNNRYPIYTSGAGMYFSSIVDLKKNKERFGVFIYPIFNPYRYRESNQKMKVIIDTNPSSDLVEGTFVTKGNITTCVVTGINMGDSNATASDEGRYGYIGPDHKKIDGLKPNSDGMTVILNSNRHPV